MQATLVGMPTDKNKKPGGGKGKRFPSRDKLSYVALSKRQQAWLQWLSDNNDRYADRSGSYLARLAVDAFLKAAGVDPTQDPPSPAGMK